MREHKPSYAMLYFSNSWNPECTEELKQGFLELGKLEPFESFVVESDLGTVGERIKKYYAVKYEPTFILLSDGMEAKRVIGSDIEEVKHFL